MYFSCIPAFPFDLSIQSGKFSIYFIILDFLKIYPKGIDFCLDVLKNVINMWSMWSRFLDVAEND